MDFKSAFGTDEKLETEGRWFPIAAGTEVKIARTGNPSYRTMLRARLKPYMQSLQKGLLDDETGDAVLIEVMARTIVKDWKGFDKDGKEYPFSTQNAVSMMSEFKDFRDFVARNADDMQSFKAEATEVTKGNSPAGSRGTSSGEKA